jgi:hypothetical protein
MKKEDLQQLVERLQQLRLQREQISAEEGRILQQIQQPTAVTIGDNNNTSTERPASRAVVEDDRAVAAAVAVQQQPVFHLGQHVYITNSITHTGLVRRATHADRAGIVTHLTNSGRIAIRTYNGFKTHRLPGNLRVLTPEEKTLYGSDRRR